MIDDEKTVQEIIENHKEAISGYSNEQLAESLLILSERMLLTDENGIIDEAHVVAGFICMEASARMLHLDHVTLTLKQLRARMN